MRILAIGDIHGHLSALDALLDFVRPSADDLMVFLGDYVDKGPNVKGVIDRLLRLSQEGNTVFLRGNHDDLMMAARRDAGGLAIWECIGGEGALASYGEGGLRAEIHHVPPEHWFFLEHTCRDYFETADYILVHGGIRPELEPADEDREHLLWMKLAVASAHRSGRTVVCGHSAQRSGEIADLGHTIGIDTDIARGGWLTCLALDSFEYWQAAADGRRRSGVLRRAPASTAKE